MGNVKANAVSCSAVWVGRMSNIIVQCQEARCWIFTRARTKGQCSKKFH